MLSIHSSRLRNSAAILALVLSGAPAIAQQVAANATNITSTTSAGEVETLVVTGTAFDPETAPAKSSLDTMEPQTIISKSYIQDSVAATGTYTTILAIAPSMTGTDLNGPGLSDGGVKNTLRGLSDGNFGINFDGVPFGDTNGPTHHSQSYFPSSTIGNVVVDRGPGNAGNMGPSTYGGSVNLFSEVLTPESHGRVSAMAGSWGTSLFNVNYQTAICNWAA
jgi:iron complex outermembrane recepter protein